jgi:hypothetical protein
VRGVEIMVALPHAVGEQLQEILARRLKEVE